MYSIMKLDESENAEAGLWRTMDPGRGDGYRWISRLLTLRRLPRRARRAEPVYKAHTVLCVCRWI